MSSEKMPGARLRRAFTGLLLALVAGLLVVVAPAHAAPQRVAKCPACAQEAEYRQHLADLLEAQQGTVDQAQKALSDAEDRYAEAKAAVSVAKQAFDAGVPIDKSGYGPAYADQLRAFDPIPALTDRYVRALLGQADILEKLALATTRLNACEADKCTAPGDSPQSAIAAAPTTVAITPGMTVALRPAACPACATPASRRNELALLVNQGEAVLQALRNGIADAGRRDSAHSAELFAYYEAERKARQAARATGQPIPPGIFTYEREKQIMKPSTDAKLDRIKLGDSLIAQTRRQQRLVAQFQQADAALTACEQQMCVQADTRPLRRVEVLRRNRDEDYRPPRPPAPPAPAGGFEVQFFGGAAVGVTGLNLTGIDDFFGPGAELFDRRSGSSTNVAPALGVFARVYIDPPGADSATPNPRFFLTAGALFTPGRGSPGFDSTGVNTVPLGTARTETSRSFLAPIMVGVQFPVTLGTTPLSLELMGGIAVGHDTTRVNLLGEGGAPGGPGASGEASGLFVDPVIGFGISAPIAAIEGLGPVRLGVMGLAVIGTGGRSVRVQSPNFGSQSYTGEHRRQVEFFFGATLSLGLF